MSKPEPLPHFASFIRAECDEDRGERLVRIWKTVDHDSKDLRDLSAWLLKAADWLEGEG